MQRINESISLLKSTKTFQMSALKSKIFKFAFVKETEHEVGFVEQKKRLRELIDFSIAEMSMK